MPTKEQTPCSYIAGDFSVKKREDGTGGDLSVEGNIQGHLNASSITAGIIDSARLPIGTENGEIPVLGAGGKLDASMIPYDALVQTEEHEFVGDGVKTNFVIEHTMGKRFVKPTIYDSNGGIILVACTCLSSTSMMVCFGNPPDDGESFTAVLRI